ncbi:acyl-CoA dehydrogenase family protein [candidate division CSSED10-310 bacterium]|uniref:Acyl-CoA dehydrogenase family protein n=1 Tax=candidate division CSSED10-310 bacterium TaxID=2855610 RepID=A0ABV6YYJ4_UNCC1
MYGNFEMNSIIKGFFTGNIRNDLIFPYPSISDEELLNLKILNDNLILFTKEHINPDRIDREGVIDAGIRQGLADIGVFAIAIPEEYDGYGFSNQAYLKSLEILASRSASVSAAVGSTYSLGVKAIQLFGTEEQKLKYLPPFASGDVFAAFAMSEESAGTDLNAIETYCNPSADGDHFLLNGVKKYVTNADFADIFIVLAKMKVDIRGRLRERISAFIVPRTYQGVSLGRKWDKLGMRGLYVSELIFNNVKIPRENELGRSGQGLNIALAVCNEGRLAQAAGCLGAMKWIYRLALGEAKTRKQFGRQIIDFELIQEKLAQMNINIFIAESMIYMVAGLIDRGDADFSTEAAACKIFSTEALWSLANSAMQIAGGQGYMKDFPYERAIRDARLHLIVNGTNEILRIFIALAGLKVPGDFLKGLGEIISNPLRDPYSAMKGLYTFTSQRFSRFLPAELLPSQGAKLIARVIPQIKTYNVNPTLTQNAKALERSIRNLANKLETLILKYSNSLLLKELVLERIANITIDLFACTAALSRMNNLIAIKGKKESYLEHSVTNVFINEAVQRIETNLATLSSNQDSLKRDIVADLIQKSSYSMGLTKYDLMKDF